MVAGYVILGTTLGYSLLPRRWALYVCLEIGASDGQLSRRGVYPTTRISSQTLCVYIKRTTENLILNSEFGFPAVVLSVVLLEFLLFSWVQSLPRQFN